VRRFDYYAPTNLREAVEILFQHGDGGRPLAGGTDLVVQLKEGGHKFPRPSYLVSLRRIPELRGIHFSETEGLRIGAATTLMEVARSPVVRQRYPIIVDGAALVGSIQTMNMGTIGGNLCNAAPSADTAPPLLVSRAQVRLVGPSGERVLPLEEFFLGPGQTVLGPAEMLTEVQVPTPPPHSGGIYVRHTPRQRMDIAVVGVGVLVSLDDASSTFREVRIALGAVAPTPILAREAGASLAGQPVSDKATARAARLAASEAKPISDVRGSAAFRRELVRVMTERYLRVAIERA
jgi:carbon-monoxide dehydrogenase medium subunit